MRDLTDEFKLSVRSLAEVFQALGAMVTGMAVTRRVRFRGKKPTRAAVVNAALLYLDSLSPQEREHALTVGMTRLEELLQAEGGDGDDAATEDDAAAAPAPPQSRARSSRTLRATEDDAAAAPAPPRRVKLKVEDVTAPRPASRKAVRRKNGG